MRPLLCNCRYGLGLIIITSYTRELVVVAVTFQINRCKTCLMGEISIYIEREGERDIPHIDLPTFIHHYAHYMHEVISII